MTYQHSTPEEQLKQMRRDKLVIRLLNVIIYGGALGIVIVFGVLKYING